MKWHLDNGRGPLIFPSLSKEFISGYGRDTNGQEGTGGWIRRSCVTTHPNLVQGLEHLATIGKVIERDLASECAGLATRYGAHKNPVQREEETKIRKKNKAEIDDCRPPDTSSHAPKKKGFGDNGLDLCHFIPWSFNTLTPTEPHVQLHVTNTCAMDTILMCLYLMRKFNTDMLEDFIHEGLLVNNVLNLIDDKEFDLARMAWISIVLESGIKRHNIIRDSATHDDDDDGQQWNCWGSISDWQPQLKMTRFVEKDLIGCCDVCNRDGAQPVNAATTTTITTTTTTTTSTPKEKEEHSDQNSDNEVIPLEYKPPQNTKKRKTMHGKSFLHFPPILMGTLQSELDKRYTQDYNVCNQVHCMRSNDNPRCHGLCTLTTTMEKAPIILVIETFLHSMSDIELTLFVAGTRYNLAFVILHNLSHFRGIAVFHDDKYVLYDGMRPTMELIDKNKRFSEGGNYHVASLWYRQVRRNQVHPVVSILVKDELSNKGTGRKKIQSRLTYETMKIKSEDNNSSFSTILINKRHHQTQIQHQEQHNAAVLLELHTINQLSSQNQQHTAVIWPKKELHLNVR